MSTEAETPALAPTSVEAQMQPTMESETVPDTNVMGELLSQLKELREHNKSLVEQNTEHQKIGKRKREAAVDGSIREMVKKLYEEYDSLGLHKDELEQQLSAMKESPQANGIVEMLSCAAAAQSSSVVQLEKALQDRKKLLEENKRLKTQVSLFADPADRVVETVTAVASRGRIQQKPENTNKFDALFSGSTVSTPAKVGQSRGMRELYPNLFENMVTTAGPSSTGMQKFGQIDTKFFNNKMTKSRVTGDGFETHQFK